MLALVSHEPHFCLLREVVSFGGANRGRPSRDVLENPCAEHFVLLQIGRAPQRSALPACMQQFQAQLIWGDGTARGFLEARRCGACASIFSAAAHITRFSVLICLADVHAGKRT